jgi:hypothetical protein
MSRSQSEGRDSTERIQFGRVRTVAQSTRRLKFSPTCFGVAASAQ